MRRNQFMDQDYLMREIVEDGDRVFTKAIRDIRKLTSLLEKAEVIADDLTVYLHPEGYSGSAYNIADSIGKSMEQAGRLSKEMDSALRSIRKQRG